MQAIDSKKKVSENDFCFPVTNVVMDSRPKKKKKKSILC